MLITETGTSPTRGISQRQGQFRSPVHIRHTDSLRRWTQIMAAALTPQAVRLTVWSESTIAYSAIPPGTAKELDSLVCNKPQSQ